MVHVKSRIPERSQDFELDLNFITTHEYLTHHADFGTYKGIAKLFLRNSKMAMTEEELQNRYNSPDLENMVGLSVHIMETIPLRKEDGTFTKRYIDIADSYQVQPEDSLYDFFFTYKLRQVTLLDLDAFLEYHLHFYYGNDMTIYKRFLNVCMRSHKDKFSPETELTVAEWIEAKQKQVSQSEDGALGKATSKRPKRDNNDHKTILTQEQTVLLAHYLQEKNVFYNGYLTNAEIGIAFEILTGYSQNTLRLNLPKADSLKTHENVKALNSLIGNLAALIAKDLPVT